MRATFFVAFSDNEALVRRMQFLNGIHKMKKHTVAEGNNEYIVKLNSLINTLKTEQIALNVNK